MTKHAVQVYRKKGLKKLYPWQAAAMESGEDGKNLVYCAPTSGGKTLVAELLMIRRLLASKQPNPNRSFGRPRPVSDDSSCSAESTRLLAGILNLPTY